MVAGAVQVVGLALIVAGIFAISMPAGIIAGGIAAVLVGVALERGR